MSFKKLSEYDDEIKKMDRMLDNFKKCMEEHPEKIGGHINYELLKYLREDLKKERDKLAASLYCDEKYPDEKYLNELFKKNNLILKNQKKLLKNLKSNMIEREIIVDY